MILKCLHLGGASVRFKTDIKKIAFSKPVNDAVNLIEESGYNSEKKGFTFLIVTENKDYLQDPNNNILLCPPQRKAYVLDELQTLLDENNALYSDCFQALSSGEDLSEVMNRIKNYFKTNVCILSPSQKLIYNNFNFKNVEQTYPLEVCQNKLQRIYAYIGVEQLREEYRDEFIRFTKALGGVLYGKIKDLNAQTDALYDTMKNLAIGVFNRSSDKSLQAIDWKTNDPYTMIVCDLKKAKSRSQELFIQSSRFKHDYPNVMYSTIREGDLILLYNAKYDQLNHVKENALSLLNDYQMDYVEADLNNGLMEFETVAKICHFVLEKGITVPNNITEAVDKIVFEMVNLELDLSVVFPEKLKILIKEDLKEKSELVKTLYYYLIEERSLQKAAAKLDIHRNSVVYRLNKIDELCHFNYDDYELRQNLISAMKIAFKRFEL